MIETRQPEVHLINVTKAVMPTCAALIDIMTNEVEFDAREDGTSVYMGVGDVDLLHKQIDDYAREPHGSVFESILTVWVLKNVSRAFQQQLTRTRLRNQR